MVSLSRPIEGVGEVCRYKPTEDEGGIAMDGGIRVAWGKVRDGREKQALELFQDAVTYYGKKMADGKVTYFEPFFLLTGDQSENTGFFIVKAPIAEIFTILDEEEFKQLNTRAYSLLDHFRIDLLTVGEGIEAQLKRYEKSLTLVS